MRVTRIYFTFGGEDVQVWFDLDAEGNWQAKARGESSDRPTLGIVFDSCGVPTVDDAITCANIALDGWS